MSLVDYDDSPPPPEGTFPSHQSSLPSSPLVDVKLLSVVRYRVESQQVPALSSSELTVSLDDDVLMRGHDYNHAATCPAVTGGRSCKSTEGHSIPTSEVNTAWPSSPPGEVNTRVIEKFVSVVESSQEGNCVNDYIRHSKRFRNPDLLEQLVTFLDVIENGSNYPSECYDPGKQTLLLPSAPAAISRPHHPVLLCHK